MTLNQDQNHPNKEKKFYTSMIYHCCIVFVSQFVICFSFLGALAGFFMKAWDIWNDIALVLIILGLVFGVVALISCLVFLLKAVIIIIQQGGCCFGKREMVLDGKREQGPDQEPPGHHAAAAAGEENREQGTDQEPAGHHAGEENKVENTDLHFAMDDEEEVFGQTQDENQKSHRIDVKQGQRNDHPLANQPSVDDLNEITFQL